MIISKWDSTASCSINQMYRVFNSSHRTITSKNSYHGKIFQPNFTKMSLWHFFSFSFLFRFKSHHPACQSYLNFVYLLLTCFVLLSLILQKQKPASSSSPYQHVNWMKLFMYLLCYIGYIYKLIWIFQGLYTSSPYFHPLVSQCRLNFFTVSHFFYLW